MLQNGKREQEAMRDGAIRERKMYRDNALKKILAAPQEAQMDPYASTPPSYYSSTASDNGTATPPPYPQQPPQPASQGQQQPTVHAYPL